MATMAKRRLAPEPWGAKMARAREAAGLTMRQVEALLDGHAGRGSLARLEARDSPPTFRGERQRAALVVTLYGFDLDTFDLSGEDFPGLIDPGRVAELGKASTKWYSPPSRAA